MKIETFLNTKAGMITAAAVIAAGALYIAEKKAAQVASDLGQAVNPLNDSNVFASGVDSVGAKLTGNQNFSLGVWIYDKLHPQQAQNEQLGVWRGVPKPPEY